jgi:quercetin dioxygenase-like cupin family protein
MNTMTQFKMRTLPLLIAPLLIALGGLTSPLAHATPVCGVVTETLAVGHYPNGSLDLLCTANLPAWLLKTIVQGDSDVYVTRHTFQPGNHTGWHSHPGPSLITVITGTLTVYEASDRTCTPKIYTAGQSFTDLGCGDVHLVRNEGNVVAQDVAVQIVPAGAQRRIDVTPAPSNCPLISCPF